MLQSTICIVKTAKHYLTKSPSSPNTVCDLVQYSRVYLHVIPFPQHRVYSSLYLRVTPFPQHRLYSSLYLRVTPFTQHRVYSSLYLRVTPFTQHRLYSRVSISTYSLSLNIECTVRLSIHREILSNDRSMRRRITSRYWGIATCPMFFHSSLFVRCS
jgi:hypothetical protein